MRRDDVVLLHDPQTAGLVPMLSWSGARVFWRCHVGTDEHNEEVERGWAFLRPYLADVTYALFSRKQYVPAFLADKSSIMVPAIDAFSPKNQPMRDEVVRAILVNTGIIEGLPGDAPPTFVALGRGHRAGESPGRRGPHGACDPLGPAGGGADLPLGPPQGSDRGDARASPGRSSRGCPTNPTSCSRE